VAGETAKMWKKRACMEVRKRLRDCGWLDGNDTQPASEVEKRLKADCGGVSHAQEQEETQGRAKKAGEEVDYDK